MPLQREKTALKRGALDDLYLHNNPRVEVAESNAGPNTLDGPTALHQALWRCRKWWRARWRGDERSWLDTVRKTGP
jgi:hypothetical protein